MEYIYIQGANKPAGHYSPAVRKGNMLFISGQVPTNPYTGEKCFGSIREQTQQVLKNLDDILKAAGADKKDVMKMTVYVSDIAYWDEVNQVYSEYFGEHKPARTIVPTRDLHYGFLVEMDAIAYIE